MKTSSAVLLAIGFIVTGVSGWWNIQTPSEDGANIGAGLLFLLGVVIGAIGLVLLIAALIRQGASLRAKRSDTCSSVEA